MRSMKKHAVNLLPNELAAPWHDYNPYAGVGSDPAFGLTPKTSAGILLNVNTGYAILKNKAMIPRVDNDEKK